MMDLNKLYSAKRVVVDYLDVAVDSDYVKEFRNKYGLTQVALANILGVSKKAIEKWEQGKNRVGGSSAVLLTLLNENNELLSKVYSVHRVNEIYENYELQLTYSFSEISQVDMFKQVNFEREIKSSKLMTVGGIV
ncbi:MAG: type II toxin-antitoxin system MqsA family antitoxin [Clostridia bacterium]|nr:type II toxin-antitoxin system MqsA family antitoxin [Clostridia bacterium]